MGGIFSLLGTPTGTISIGSASGDSIAKVMADIEGYVNIAVMVFLAVCALLVVLFAVYIGFRMAKAEDDKARNEAKQQLIYTIIGAIVIIILAVLMGPILDSLAPAAVDVSTNSAIDEPVNEVLGAIGSVVTAVLKIFASVAVAFAIYIGWQLMKAEDEKKRGDAKKQLIYTCIGIIAIVLVNVVASMVLQNLASQVG